MIFAQVEEVQVQRSHMSTSPRGGDYFHIITLGGLDCPCIWRQIWGKVQPSRSANMKEEEILGSLVTTRGKNWNKIAILGSYLKFKGQILGNLSPVIFECKIWGSDTKFRGKFWGQAPPHLLIWKYPPLLNT